MGDGTKESPYTREDVLRLIEENGGEAGGLDLSEKVFEDGIDLRGLGENSLRGINFSKAIFLLNLKKLKKNYPFRGANLRGIHLDGAQLRGTQLREADLSDVFFHSANLGDTHLEEADLSGVHFGNAYLGDSHLQGAILYKAEFSVNTGLEEVDWGNFILGDEDILGLDMAADTYRRLKIWYTEHGMYDIAGEFYFREMTVRRKAMKWLPNPLIRSFYKIVSMLCGYGERPERVVISAAAAILTAALVYFLVGSLFDLSAFGRSLYFSAVSFTALGYGSWITVDSNVIKGLGAAESFLGVFMMALFLVTFTRKMTR